MNRGSLLRGRGRSIEQHINIVNRVTLQSFWFIFFMPPPFIMGGHIASPLFLVVVINSMGTLDLAVLFTPFTPNRQNKNQVHRNTCADVRQGTPSSEVV